MHMHRAAIDGQRRARDASAPRVRNVNVIVIIVRSYVVVGMTRASASDASPDLSSPDLSLAPAYSNLYLPRVAPRHLTHGTHPLYQPLTSPVHSRVHTLR